MKTLLLNSIFTLGLLILPGVTYAAIEVDFETTPLFGVANFLPGDTVVKTVTVKNTGEVAEDVQTELYNVIGNGLSEMVSVSISSGDNALYTASFEDFDDAGEVFLSTLNAGDTVTYSYALSFAPESGNDYQNKTLGFDLCVGFEGGQFECDKITNPGGGGGGYSQGSYGSNSGGGGGGGGERISLSGGFNDNDDDEDEDDGPIPQVLGDQDSIIPLGAPNTGFGGSATSMVYILVILLSTLATLLIIWDRMRSIK